MRLPACCRDLATNEHRSVACAASFSKHNRPHMIHSSTSGSSNVIGCAWAAGCQSKGQSGGYMPIGNVNQNVIISSVGPAYCCSMLGSSLTGQACDGSVPQEVSTATAAQQCSQKAAFKQQGSMMETLVDMRPAEDIPVYVMLPLDTVSCFSWQYFCSVEYAKRKQSQSL